MVRFTGKRIARLTTARKQRREMCNFRRRREKKAIGKSTQLLLFYKKTIPKTTVTGQLRFKLRIAVVWKEIWLQVVLLYTHPHLPSQQWEIFYTLKLEITKSHSFRKSEHYRNEKWKQMVEKMINICHRSANEERKTSFRVRNPQMIPKNRLFSSNFFYVVSYSGEGNAIEKLMWNKTKEILVKKSTWKKRRIQTVP